MDGAHLELFNGVSKDCLNRLESLSNSIDVLRKFHKSWLRQCTLTDNAIFKMSQLKRNSQKLQEQLQAIDMLRRKHYLSAIDLAIRINTFYSQFRNQFLNILISWAMIEDEHLKGKIQTNTEQIPKLQELQQENSYSTSTYASVIQYLKKTARLTSAGFEVTTSESATLQYEGYLFRKTNITGFKRYFVILKDGCLSFYKNDMQIPKLVINLLTCSAKASVESSRNFCFKIQIPLKTYLLQAESHESMTQWLKNINQAISLIFHRMAISTRDELTHTTPFESPRSNPSDMNWKSNSMFQWNERTSFDQYYGRLSKSLPDLRYLRLPLHDAPDDDSNSTNQLDSVPPFLTQLYHIDANNKRCVDCHSKKPTWLSINLGILMCLECSGVHRAMGTHISRIKSSLFDKIDPVNIVFISQIGNMKINAIFDPENHCMIKKEDDRKHRDHCIRLKYQHKGFISPYQQKDDLLDKSDVTDEINVTDTSITSPNDANYDSLSPIPSYDMEISIKLKKLIQLDFYQSIKNNDISSTVKLYVQGADVNYCYRSENGRYPIHCACKEGHIVILEFLLQNLANVDVQDRDGKTALHYSCYSSLFTTLVLCRFNPSLDILDNDGKTAFEIAKDQSADTLTILRLAKYAKEESIQDKMQFVQIFDTFVSDMEYYKSIEEMIVQPSLQISSRNESNQYPEKLQSTMEIFK